MGDSLEVVQPQAAGGGVTCLAFSPIARRGSLLGFADFHIVAFRMRLLSCTAHEQDGKRWIGLPGRPWVNRDAELVRDEATGKVKYQPVVAFDSKDILDRFSSAAVAALDLYQPGWDR